MSTDIERIQALDLAEFNAFRAKFGDRRPPKGQLDQDLFVLYQTSEKRGGYFVEFGACDGLLYSNSLLLERSYGWTGIVAEPNPIWHRDLKRNRTCKVATRCVTAESGKTETFLDTAHAELAGMKRTISVDGNTPARAAALEIQVPTVSLHDMLTEHGAPQVIDYLSVDTEGSELLILEAFPWSKWDVRLISVEHNHTPARDALHALLTKLGYQRTLESVSDFDSWYVRTMADYLR